jgi:hypothetical protein
MTVPSLPRIPTTPILDAAIHHLKVVTAIFFGIIEIAWFLGADIPWSLLLLVWFVPTFAYMLAAAIADSIGETLLLLNWAPWRWLKAQFVVLPRQKDNVETMLKKLR